MSKYINLIDKIPSAEKQTIVNYIDCYGVKKEDFIGLDKWLQNWSHSNQILYKLLGNQLIREFDFTYVKPEQSLRDEVIDKLMDSTFKNSYHNFYVEYVSNLDNPLSLTRDERMFFNHLMDTSNFINDKIRYGLKYKAPSAKKMLQIQAGAKPLRAITRVIEYFKDTYTFEGFEDFRIKHSLIMNDRTIKGKICISIHPLDFMTMSDNASNWQSCMSWEHEGCYRVGTIEMMNSNNVVCAYLKNTSTPFFFKNIDTKEIKGEWTNKQWRQLFYINKDIIMSGKAYPYKQEDITYFVLNTLKSLAEENLNWTYAFGIEPYKDMIHINDLYKMNKQRTWMQAKSRVKNNIIWDTKGMYNDMLNDNDYPYYCYRNKVKHTKIYNASGKCPCLQCGGSITKFDEDEYDYYNDRYHNTGAVLCTDCYDRHPGCDWCDTYAPTLNITILNSDCGSVYVCDKCKNTKIRLCPCCGDPMIISWSSNYFVYSPVNYDKFKYVQNKSIDDYFYMIDPYFKTQEYMDKTLVEEPDYVETVYICKECQKKLIKEYEELGIIKVMTESRWDRDKYYYFIDPEKYQSWRYYNLSKPKNNYTYLKRTA